MDLIKIGKFIADTRKKKNLTQIQLAERLSITDRAVSKWECGRSMPDSSIMLELCEVLEISVNELLTGEELEMEDYNKQTELNMIELVKQKEESDKKLLMNEIVVGITGTLFLFTCVAFGVYFAKTGIIWLAILLIVVGFIFFLTLCFIAVSVEQKAGYYECQVCHNRFVPTYKQALFALHIGRKRRMECPKCGEKSYCKKVISKNGNN